MTNPTKNNYFQSQLRFRNFQSRNFQSRNVFHYHAERAPTPTAASAMNPNAGSQGPGYPPYGPGRNPQQPVPMPMYSPGPSGYNTRLPLQSGSSLTPGASFSQHVPIAPRPQNLHYVHTSIRPEGRTWNGIPMLEGSTSVSMRHLIKVSIENQFYLRYIAHPQFPPQLGLGYAKIIDTNDYLERHANNTLKRPGYAHMFAQEGVQAQDAIVTIIYNYGFTKNDRKDSIKRMDPAKAMKCFFDLGGEFQWIRREPIEGEWSTFITRSFGTVVCGFFKGDGPPLLAPIKSNETSWRIADDGQWMPGTSIDVTGRYEANHPEMVKLIGAEWGRHVLQSKKWLPGPGVKIEFRDRSMPMGDMDVIIPLYRNHLKQQEERRQQAELKGKTKAGGKGKSIGKGKGKAVDVDDEQEEEEDDDEQEEEDEEDEDDEDDEDLEEEDAMEMRIHRLADMTDPPSEDPQPSSLYNPDDLNVPSPSSSGGDDAMDGDYKK